MKFGEHATQTHCVAEKAVWKNDCSLLKNLEVAEIVVLSHHGWICWKRFKVKMFQLDAIDLIAFINVVWDKWTKLYLFNHQLCQKHMFHSLIQFKWIGCNWIFSICFIRVSLKLKNAQLNQHEKISIVWPNHEFPEPPGLERNQVLLRTSVQRCCHHLARCTPEQ